MGWRPIRRRSVADRQHQGAPLGFGDILESGLEKTISKIQVKHGLQILKIARRWTDDECCPCFVRKCLFRSLGSLGAERPLPRWPELTRRRNKHYVFGPLPPQEVFLAPAWRPSPRTWPTLGPERLTQKAPLRAISFGCDRSAFCSYMASWSPPGGSAGVLPAWCEKRHAERGHSNHRNLLSFWPCLSQFTLPLYGLDLKTRKNAAPLLLWLGQAFPRLLHEPAEQGGPDLQLKTKPWKLLLERTLHLCGRLFGHAQAEPELLKKDLDRCWTSFGFVFYVF